jgi:hypothetical protein
MRYSFLVGLFVLSVAPVAASAHTKEDEAACRPDVFRLCSAAIPNQNRIVACLARNKSQLSSACSQVFDRSSNGKGGAPMQTDMLPQWGR